MSNIDSIDRMDESQLRDFARRLLNQVSDNQKQIAEFSNIVAQRDADIAERDRAIQVKDQLIRWKEDRIIMLTHEMAVLKRWKFGRSREGLNADQLSLLDETIDADIAGIMGGAQGDPIRICDRLIETSLARGGEDNVTVVVVTHP